MSPNDKEFKAKTPRSSGWRRTRWGLDAAILVWLLCAWIAPEWTPGVSADAGVFGDYMQRLKQLAGEAPDLAFGLYLVFQVLCAIIGIPPSNVVGLAGAAVFGFWPAFLVAWPGGVLGGVVGAFLVRRFCREAVRRRWPAATDALAKVAATGPFGLVLSMWLTPVVPAVLANAFIGVSPVSLWTFAWASLVGRIPLTYLYCSAGKAIRHAVEAGVLVDRRAATLLAAAALLPHALSLAKAALVGRRGSAVQA